jgi:hypothetical protein
MSWISFQIDSSAGFAQGALFEVGPDVVVRVYGGGQMDHGVASRGGVGAQIRSQRIRIQHDPPGLTLDALRMKTGNDPPRDSECVMQPTKHPIVNSLLKTDDLCDSGGNISSSMLTSPPAPLVCAAQPQQFVAVAWNPTCQCTGNVGRDACFSGRTLSNYAGRAYSNIVDLAHMSGIVGKPGS